MRTQIWTSTVTLLLSACANDQSSHQEQSEKARGSSVAEAEDDWGYEDEYASNTDVEIANDNISAASKQSESQSDGASEVEVPSFYGQGYPSGQSKQAGDPKIKICARNEVDGDIHFRVAQDVGGAFGTILNKGSSFCSSDLTSGRMTVALDKQGPRYCGKRVKPGDSFSLVRFNENGGCVWEEYQQ